MPLITTIWRAEAEMWQCCIVHPYVFAPPALSYIRVCQRLRKKYPAYAY